MRNPLTSDSYLRTYKIPDAFNILSTPGSADLLHPNSNFVHVGNVLEIPNVKRAQLALLDETQLGALEALRLPLGAVQQKGRPDLLTLEHAHPFGHAV